MQRVREEGVRARNAKMSRQVRPPCRFWIPVCPTCVLETVRVGTLLDKKHRFLRRSWDFKTLRIALSLFSYLPSLLSLKLTTISCSAREQRLAVTLCTICDLSQLGSQSLTETIVRRKSRDAKKPIRVPPRQAPITITTIKPTNLNRKGIKDILWPPAAWFVRNAHAYPRCCLPLATLNYRYK